MIKLDIVNELVARTGISKVKAEMAVEAVFDNMKRALGNIERIELRGFGISMCAPAKRVWAVTLVPALWWPSPQEKWCVSNRVKNCSSYRSNDRSIVGIRKRKDRGGTISC